MTSPTPNDAEKIARGPNFSDKGKIIQKLGGPGHLIGYGFTQDEAIQLAIAAQLARTNDLIAAACRLAEEIAARTLLQKDQINGR